MHAHQTPATQNHQRGMVLIVALIILLVLTILGVSGMSTTSLQERMAANEHDRQIAFQTAEAALRQGESFVQNNSMDASMFDNNCTNGLCDCHDSTGCPVYWTDPTLKVWATANRHKTVATAFTQVAAQPEYIIEFMGYTAPPGSTSTYVPTAGDPMMFRITALGTGQSPTAQVMLQSTYKKD